MPTERTPEEIAKGLTKAQRRFVSCLNPGNGWYSAPKDGHRRNARGRSLAYLGLFDVMYDKANGLDWFRWLPLGRAVAAILAQPAPSETEGRE